MPSNVDKMIAYLVRRQLAFYHFTDAKNLPSIREWGLLSLHRLVEEELAFTPGGNEWSHDADRYKGVDRYVHLSLTPNHPMEYCAKQDGRIEKSVILKVHPKVLAADGARITLGVANASDVPILEPEEAILSLDFGALYPKSKWRDDETFERYKIARKGELLIPDRITTEMIIGL